MYRQRAFVGFRIPERVNQTKPSPSYEQETKPRTSSPS